MVAKALGMIFITGAARSGTSLTTKILQAHGLWLGGPGQVNDLYEHQEIRQTVLKPMLVKVGADPLGQGPLPDMSKFRPDVNLRRRVEQYFAGAPKPWGYKDAKLTLTWPMWHAAFPEAKWIIVRRDHESNIDSCIRTHFMRRYGGNRRKWAQWIDFHLAQFDDMKDAGVEIQKVWPNDFIQSPFLFRPAVEFAGLEFDFDKVTSAINPKLWRS
jgi:hypothetical protein